MITIQEGKLIIPEEDRFVGFAGDNLGNSKAFVIPDHGDDSSSYTLCLRFDDDSVRVIPLTKSVRDSNLILTWDILSVHLLKAGIVMAQVKSVGSDDVILHTGCDYFVVAESAVEDESDIDYVSREEMEERMAAMLRRVRESAPYIGEDGYWYVYDVVTDSYVRSAKATGEIAIDSEMIADSTNPVASNAIRTYVESGLNAKVDKNTYVAGLPLSGNISRKSLVENIIGTINPPLVVPDTTHGYGGQFGKTTSGEPVMCRFSTSWIQLATADNVYSKSDIDSMIGNLETILSAV